MTFTLTGTGYGTPVAHEAHDYRAAIEAAANDSAAVTVLNTVSSNWTGLTDATGTRTTTSPPIGAPIARSLISDKYTAETSTGFPFNYNYGQAIASGYFTWLCYVDDNDLVELGSEQLKFFRMTYLADSVTDSRCPSLYFKRTYQSGTNWTEQFTVHQSATGNSPADGSSYDSNQEVPGTDEFYCPAKNWCRIEFWFKESSGIDVADGYLKLRITKLSDSSFKEHTFSTVSMYTSYLDVANQGRRYSNFLFQNYIGNGTVYTGVADVQIYLADIHMQRGHRGVVYLGNAATWAGCTIKVPQNTATWTNTEITGEYHPGELTTENGNYLYVMLDDGSMYSASGVAVGEPVLPSLSSVYTNLTVAKGAAVGVVDWGVNHWSDADSVTITGVPSSIDASDAEDITGNWPSTDRTYLVKAVASNADGNSSPAYFTVQVGEGSAISAGTTGGIIGRVIR
jgi:hypothetical protein